MNAVDPTALLIDLAHATEALAAIRETALSALPHTSQSRAFHDPLLDIVGTADTFLNLTPKETSCATS